MKTVIRLSHTADCGCELQIGFIMESSTEEEFADKAKHLHHWYTDRSKRHRCELVSKENPSGLAPREG